MQLGTVQGPQTGLIRTYTDSGRQQWTPDGLSVNMAMIYVGFCHPVSILLLH